jgi:hypothetical protein
VPVRQASDVASGEAEFGVGRSGGDDAVVTELDSGDRQHFSAVVDEVVRVWTEMLRSAAD